MDEELFDEDVSEYFKPDPEYESLDHEEIVRKLEEGAFLEDIKNSETWRVFREAWRRIYLGAEAQLDNVSPDKVARIAELQVTKRFYRDLLATTIRRIKEDGKAAFEQAKERGILDKFIPQVKKDY
jgi:hypothetical protein